MAHNFVRPLTWLGLLDESPLNAPATLMVERRFRKTVLFDNFFKIVLPNGMQAVGIH